MDAALELAKSNPALTGVAVAVTGGLAVVAAPVLVVAPMVAGANMIGFTAGGVGAGTLAAGAQAGIGNVVAPSLFATLTSAAAGGYGLAQIAAAAQVAGGTVAGAAGAVGAWLYAK